MAIMIDQSPQKDRTVYRGWFYFVLVSILETWNANDVIVYVWLIHSQIKCTKMHKIYNKKLKQFRLNPRLSLLRCTTLVLSI